MTHGPSPAQTEHLNATVLSEVAVEGEGPRDLTTVEQRRNEIAS